MTVPFDRERHERIKMMLHVRGSSFSDVAREMGVTVAAVANVSRGLKRSKRLEEAIAAKLETNCQEIWPERRADV